MSTQLTLKPGKIQPVAEHQAWLYSAKCDWSYIRNDTTYASGTDKKIEELDTILSLGLLTEYQAFRGNALISDLHKLFRDVPKRFSIGYLI